ncbi:hypothetical protein [Candidatus Pseudothioglobus sp. Uisw_016]|uniref:hypothetical protein n=1 Tax=Candidatus Pseudothioglobus sp. Uisw_016 TaxID=3230995 RepID=UPI003A8C3854
MKKLLLLLLLSFFSVQSLAVPNIFSCEVKQDLSIHEDSINDVKRVDTFIFTDEIDNIVFSNNYDKRPALILHKKFKIIESRRDSDEYFNLSGEAVTTKIPFSFVYYLEEDYGFLSIAYSRANNARVMIARCVAF